MIEQPPLVPFLQYLEETCHQHAIPASKPAAAEPEQQTRDHKEHHSNQKPGSVPNRQQRQVGEVHAEQDCKQIQGQKHGRKDGEELQDLVGALRTRGKIDLHQGIDIMLHDDGMLVDAAQVLLQVVVANRQRGIHRPGGLQEPAGGNGGKGHAQ